MATSRDFVEQLRCLINWDYSPNCALELVPCADRIVHPTRLAGIGSLYIYQKDVLPHLPQQHTFAFMLVGADIDMLAHPYANTSSSVKHTYRFSNDDSQDWPSIGLIPSV